MAVMMQSIDSSLIERAGYDHEAGELHVVFTKKSGPSDTTYVYPGVPVELWNEMMDAPSVGSYFLQSVKPTYGSTFRKYVRGVEVA